MTGRPTDDELREMLEARASQASPDANREAMAGLRAAMRGTPDARGAFAVLPVSTSARGGRLPGIIVASGLVAVILVAVLGGQLSAPKEASSAGVVDTHVPESIPTLGVSGPDQAAGFSADALPEVMERRTSRGSPHRSGHRGPGRGPHRHAHHQPLQCRWFLRDRHRRDRGRAGCLPVPAQGPRPCRTGHSDGNARPRRRRPRLPRPAEREPGAATHGRGTPCGGLDARTGPARRRLARATAAGRGNAALSGPSAIAVRVSSRWLLGGS